MSTILREPLRSDRSSIQKPVNSRKRKSKRAFVSNWGIWVLGLILSVIPLLILPYLKSLDQEDYAEWFLDIFGNTGIIMITASLALAATFEGIIKTEKINKPQGGLLVIAFVCYILYGAMSIKQNTPIIARFAVGNMFLFCTMIVFSSWSFGVLPYKSLRSIKIPAIFKKR